MSAGGTWVCPFPLEERREWVRRSFWRCAGQEDFRDSDCRSFIAACGWGRWGDLINGAELFYTETCGLVPEFLAEMRSWRSTTGGAL